MANLEAETLYPEQWNRMIFGHGNGQAWGPPEPKRAEMNGKTKEQLLNWASACRAKVAYWIGRIPDDQSKNDGFDEVRAAWFHLRALFLQQQAELLEPTNGEISCPRKPSTSNIRPMEVFPFGGRAAFITKRQRFEAEDANGYGETEEKPPAEEPSPAVLPEELKKPFRPPRKKAKTTPAPPTEGEMRWLAEVDLPCKEDMPAPSDEEDDPLLHQVEEINGDSEEE